MIIAELCDGKNLQFARAIGVNESNIRSYLAGTQPKYDVLSTIATTFAINCDWLLTGRGSMLKSQESKQVAQTPLISTNPIVGAPYYDVDFIGGFSEIFNDQTSLPSTNIVIRGFEKANLWCNVTGHSMEPKINHGDIIGLRECRIDDIQYGEIYAVVLDTIRTIKILRKSTDPQKLRYVPINKTEYDEQEFPLSRIIKVYEVIGSVKKFF